MDQWMRRIIRRADRTLGRVQHRIQRYLYREAGVQRPPKKLTIGSAYERRWEGMDCVFALSTGRTGTQTLAALLRLAPGVDARHEPAPRLVKATYDAFMERGSEGWLEKWTAIALAARDDFVLEACAAGRVYVESNNRLTYIADALYAAFPASKFIFSHRDPYQVIRSGMQRGAYQGPGMAWNFARIHPSSGDPDAAGWQDLSPLQKEAWRWARVNRMAYDFFHSLPEDRRYELPAAALFSGREAIYREIFDFVGVSCPPRTEIQAVMGRKMNAQAHFNGRSFEWTDEAREQVRPIIEPVARLLGYEE